MRPLEDCKMTNAQLTELEQRMLATERLLSTMIALIAARDPQFLRELQAVFADPDFSNDEAGRAASATWSRISADLRTTGAMVDSLGKGSLN